MNEGDQLKYGWIKGGKTSVPVVAYASTHVAASSKFVYMNDGVATLCDDSIQTIFGHLETEAQTVSSGEILNCIIDLTAIFRVPIISGTYVAGMIGDYVDIDISGGVQGVDLSASSHDPLMIVGGDADNSTWCDVVIDPLNWGTAAGADD